MKKKILLVILLCLSFCFSACVQTEMPRGVESATELSQKITEAMQNVKSYRTDIVGDAVLYVNNVKVNGDITGIEIIDDSKQDKYYYVEQLNVMTGNSINQTSKSIIAYKNGEMYKSIESDMVKQKIRSSTSAEDFEAYRAKDDVKIDATKFTNISYGKVENVGWYLSASILNQDTVKQFSKQIGYDSEVFDSEIEDIEIYAVVDFEYVLKSYKITLKFKTVQNRTPSFVINGTISQINAVERITDTINQSKYTSCDDITKFKVVKDAIDYRKNEISSSFSHTLSQRYYVNGIEVSEYTEDNEISISNPNTDLAYTISSNIDGQNFIITYYEGTQKVMLGNTNLGESSIDESSAKTYIHNFIDHASFNEDYVLGYSLKPNKKYEFVMNVVDKTTYANVLSQQGAILKSVTMTITYRMSLGKIVEVDSTITAKGTKSGTTGVELVIRQVTKF